MIYGDDVCVAHPLRHTWDELHARHTRFARAGYDVHNLGSYSLPRFILDILINLLPPPAYLLRILTTKLLQDFKQRVKVILVEMYVRLIRAVETIRLRRSAESRRS
jgi:hypothetical protein